MQVETNNYLKFTSLSKTVFWDFYSLSNRNFINSKFSLVKLKEVLKHRKDFITINEQDIYKRCRVQIQGRGVVLRDEIIGKEIKTKKQQVCKTDDFLVAEIDAKVGGYGIVPKDLENAIVSGHYFLFDIDKTKLLPEFLGIVVKQNHFSKQVKSTGSTNYAAIRPYHVLEYQIPLPSIDEQNRIIKNYNEKIKKAEEQQNKANELEKGIEEYLFEELGIDKTREKQNKKGLHFYNFKNIDRWATWTVNDAFISKKYPSVLLGRILKMKSGLFLPVKSQINGNYKIYGGNGFTGLHNEFSFKGKRLIIGRVGEYCGNVHLIDGKYWVTDNAFITDKINNNFNEEFLLETLKILNLNKFRVISAQPSLSQQNLVNIPIPLPPMKIQKEIVLTINKIKSDIENLKKLSEQNRKTAEQEFEKEIFKK